MGKKIKLTELGKKARLTLNWILIESEGTPASLTGLQHHRKGRKNFSMKELQDIVLPALVKANLITIEE